jgi:plasmid recombination enzyme
MANEISISMQLSSGKTAITNLDKIKICDAHNNRKFTKNKNECINDELTKYNEILIGTNNINNDIKEFYKKEFKEAVYEYNKNQKDERRKIADYLEKMEKDKKSNIGVEFIFQLGNVDDWKDKTIEEKQKTIEIFKKAIPLLEKRNIKCFSAVVHLDETNPHMHLLAVPVVENQKRGLSKQVSQNKVITPKVLEELRKEVEDSFITEYNKVFDDNKTIKRGSEIPYHLSVEDYKQTKKVIEVAKKVKNKILLKEAVEKDLEKFTAELKKKESKEKELSNKLTLLENTLNDDYNKITKLETTIEATSNKLTMLEDERNKMNTQVQDLQDNIKDLEDKKTENNSIFERYNKDIEETRDKIKHLKEEYNKLEDERLEETKKNEDIKRDIEEQNRIKKEQQEILEKLENAEKSNAEKKKKLKEIEAENRELLEKIENAESNKLSNSNKLTLLEDEMKDFNNVYTEEQEALDKLKTFKKTVFNISKNDDYVIQAKFKKLEMFRDTLNDVIDNVTVFAMHIKEAFKTIKNSLENGVEENTLVEDINSIITTELKTGMEDFNSYYEEKQKDKIKDTIEEIKEIEIEKDF